MKRTTKRTWRDEKSPRAMSLARERMTKHRRWQSGRAVEGAVHESPELPRCSAGRVNRERDNVHYHVRRTEHLEGARVHIHRVPDALVYFYFYVDFLDAFMGAIWSRRRSRLPAMCC